MAPTLDQLLGPALKRDEPLAPHVSFKIGGKADYFFCAQDNKEFILALKTADNLQIPYFILGSGSNILISDQGIRGLVIKPENKTFKITDQTIFAESGALVVDVLDATLKANLTGWAWAAGLPGTIGGAIRGNAGAYGKAMGDIVTAVELYIDQQVQTYTNEQMRFSYRHSLLKEKPAVVLSTTFKLERGDIEQEKSQVKAYEDRREKTQPQEYPNCGCVFKNIDLKEMAVDKARIIKELDVSEAEYNEATKFNKLPISFIIDHLGLKGKRIGDAQVSEKHAAFIVNVGEAKAEEVIILMSDIKMRVRNQLGIQLQEEIQYVGF